MTLTNNTSTTSKRSCWPAHTHSLWVVSARESVLTLSDGHTYDDWASGLGSNTLGYDALALHTPHPAASLPWIHECELAECVCDAMRVDAVRFFKSGSDAVSCAVRLARAYTERPSVVVFDACYHGTGDWHGPNLWARGGIVDQPHTRVLRFGVDVTLESDTACVVVEPVPKALTLPPLGWLAHLRAECDRIGALLVSDEVILGYRHTLQGYMHPQHIRADLTCYGKAMAQGYALGMCCGQHDVMSLLCDRVHFSGTNNGEPGALWVANRTLTRYLTDNVCKQLNTLGSTLREMLHMIGFPTRGLDTRFEVVFETPEQRLSAIDACWAAHVAFPGWCSMAVTHTFEQMMRLIDTLHKWQGGHT